MVHADPRAALSLPSPVAEDPETFNALVLDFIA
jgi:hypothetical protein